MKLQRVGEAEEKKDAAAEIEMKKSKIAVRSKRTAVKATTIGAAEI